MNWNLASPVFEQCHRTPDRLALFADETETSYAELAISASRLAAALNQRELARGSRIGILGSRSRVAVEAVLGVSWAGAAYVPLGLNWPGERLQTVLDRVDLDAIIADERGLAHLTPSVIGSVEHVWVPGDGGPAGTIPLRDLPGLDTPAEPVSMTADDLAYIIFTSGTTGVPKGVMVGTGSVSAYLVALALRKGMSSSDRASQFTELTFDPALGEIFVPWRSGASLHVVPAVSRVSPAKYVRDRCLTIWGSAPAAISWMRATRSLMPGSLSGLRYSSFGGEPLPLASVKAWQAAAPNSVVDNLYGPTEATVDCVGQRVGPGADPIVTPGRGILAIGVPHPGTELEVFGPDRRPVRTGEAGELAIAGKQLSLGYLGQPEVTAARFPVIDGKRWYLTGDLAMRDNNGIFHHLGRMDNQIKIHGHRVELEDIEAHLRAASGSDQVAAMAWPVEDGVARDITAFVAGCDLPPERIREALRRRLPAYMVPATIQVVAALPVNPSGKLDRKALLARLEGEAKV